SAKVGLGKLTADLAQPSQFARISGQNRGCAHRKCLRINRTFSPSLVVQTYPLCRRQKAWHSQLEHVLAMPPAEEGRQRTPLLQRRGKPPPAIRQSRTAPCAVPGRDQRQPAGGLAQIAGSVR